jgi:hypothetical protein
VYTVLEHPAWSNALDAILTAEPGIRIERSSGVALNDDVPIEVTDVGMSTDTVFGQYWNAKSPMLTTVLGMTSAVLVKHGRHWTTPRGLLLAASTNPYPRQLGSAKRPIDTPELGIEIVARLGHSRKAP